MYGLFAVQGVFLFLPGTVIMYRVFCRQAYIRYCWKMRNPEKILAMSQNISEEEKIQIRRRMEEYQSKAGRLLAFALQFAITPFGEAVFETVGLSAVMWGKMILTAVTVIIINELYKAAKHLLKKS